MAGGDLEAFMATMVGSAAAVSTEDVEKLARDRYGLTATAARLTGERDENFRLTCADGARYVLKIASAAEEPEITDLPTAALLHLERVDPRFPCPRLVRTLDGRTVCRYRDRAGLERTVRILTYLPGKTLRSTTRSRAQRVASGRIAARLGLALREFTHPAARRPLIWDLRNVGRVVGLLEDLPDLREREQIMSLLGRIAMLTDGGWPRLRQQVINNDLTDLNLLVAPDGEAVIVGVIDFGDLVHTALVADVAIVAADQLAAGESVRDSLADIVIGYGQTLPLLPSELELLNPLIAGRVLTDVVIPAWHRQRNPGGTHYSDLLPETVRARVALAAELLSMDLPL